MKRFPGAAIPTKGKGFYVLAPIQVLTIVFLRILTAYRVAEEAGTFMKGARSRSVAVTLPDKEILHVEVTRGGVSKVVRILGDDSSSTSGDEFE